MTAAVLVWHERQSRERGNKWWQLTTLKGEKVASTYHRPPDGWAADTHRFNHLSPVKIARAVPSADAAKVAVESYLDERSSVFFGTDDLTILTWESESEAERLSGIKPRIDWKRFQHFDYAEAERRAMAQYKEAMKIDADDDKFMKDYFG